VLLVATNVPAIYLASKKYGVISLFLVADLVCATSVLPTFLGLLQRQDRGILKAPTELGAFLGCVSGVVTVLINGVVNDAEGGLFEYFWLKNGAICALCGSKTMVSFIVTPCVSLVMTYIFSFLDILVRGERARRPIISVHFDKDSKSDDSEKGVVGVVPMGGDGSVEKEETEEQAIDSPVGSDEPRIGEDEACSELSA
jgi:hypothetical protein